MVTGFSLLDAEFWSLDPRSIKKSKHTQFTLFPDDSSKMEEGAEKAGITLDGPYSALIIKGYSDESGKLAGIYEKLSQAGINVYESSGIANIKDSYGVVLYLNEKDCEKALTVLNKGE